LLKERERERPVRSWDFLYERYNVGKNTVLRISVKTTINVL